MDDQTNQRKSNVVLHSLGTALFSLGPHNDNLCVEDSVDAPRNRVIFASTLFWLTRSSQFSILSFHLSVAAVYRSSRGAFAEGEVEELEDRRFRLMSDRQERNVRRSNSERRKAASKLVSRLHGAQEATRDSSSTTTAERRRRASKNAKNYKTHRPSPRTTSTTTSSRERSSNQMNR